MADSSADPVRSSSRRTFLAVAGVGAAAVGTAAVLPAASASAAPAESAAPAHAGPLVAHVTNVRTGAISVYVDESEVVVHDRDLARRLAAVAARAK